MSDPVSTTASRSIQPGLSPGTPVFVGERKLERARMHAMEYTRDRLDEYDPVSIEECRQLRQRDSVCWINISGLHDIELISAVANTFDLHPLTLEDIANSTQRPKAEEYEDYLFIALKTLRYRPGTDAIETGHLSLILGQGFVLTFTEENAGLFDNVRKRIVHSRGQIRARGPDYLCYALADAVVDHYFLALEQFDDHIETLDEAILDRPQTAQIQEVHRLKREMIEVRRAIWPLREGIGLLNKADSALIEPETRIYLRDLYDHIIQVIEMVEGYRDILGSLHDTCLSSVSQRLNEVMKLLTIIATIFIPLTFIVGVYGMNFAYMPELQWRWGYFIVWGLMILIAIGMAIQFKRRNWW
ncbi:MAG: magnesium/cobalt transporter CorA [Oceanospirillaceae bacterium]|nr:magnesium/cobalt transporter CorA [Oceanospirillaceae bacterium]